MTSSQNSEATKSLPSEVDATMEDATTYGGDWPEGNMIPLNARCLTMPMLRQIGEALGVPSSASTPSSELRLMVEGKLTELGYDLSNIQIILSDEINRAMYLVNDEGVIKCIKNVATHVIDRRTQCTVCYKRRA